jgi:hypothetical protein
LNDTKSKIGTIDNFIKLINNNIITPEQFTPLFDALNDPKRKLGTIENFITLINHCITTEEQFIPLFDELNDPKRKLGTIDNFLFLVQSGVTAPEKLTKERIELILEKMKKIEDVDLRLKLMDLQTFLQKELSKMSKEKEK